jgi:antitoxin MazE
MATIQKWGNSLAVRIPAAMAEQLQLELGTPIEIQPKNGALVVRPRKRVKYRLGDLLKDCKPSQLHGELDFGPDVGRERID